LRALPGTLKPVPWADGAVAQVQVDMSEMGQSEPSDLSSRAALGRVVDLFNAKGLHPVVATELEFYVSRLRQDRDAPPAPLAHVPDIQNYDLEVMDLHRAFLDDVRDASAAQSLPTDTLIAEYGPGQFEINFHHTRDVLAAADTALLFRRLVRGVAQKHGLEASFMAKPYAAQPGNGMHAHLSLIDADGSNVFDGPDAPNGRLQRAIAGCLATMGELQAIFAPHRNSYRRFQPGSFAPTTPDWGMDNRAVSVRLPETSGPGARLEHRLCGADVNPYLALAAILASVLRGLERDLPLPEPLGATDETQGAPLGHDWAQAMDRIEHSEIARDFLGSLHPVYLAVKREELAVMDAEITPAEYRYGFSRL